MKSSRSARHLAAFAAIFVIAGMGALTAACGGKEKEEPTTTTTTTTATTTAPPTTPPPPSPTENMPPPTGGNVFTPNPIPNPPQTTHRQREYPYPGAGPT
jgi:hypothetical protein